MPPAGQNYQSLTAVCSFFAFTNDFWRLAQAAAGEQLAAAMGQVVIAIGENDAADGQIVVVADRETEPPV